LTWTEIAHTVLGAQQGNVNGQDVTRVGSLCWWDNIAFASVNDGWLTQDGPCWGTLTNPSPLQLLTTHDGGVSWSPEVIADPAMIYTTPFVAPPGLVVLTASYPPRENLAPLMYVSVDSGRKWSTRPLPNELNAFFDFVDSVHGWAMADQNPITGLYRTTDGGATWVVINSAPPFQGNVDLQFVDAKDGFAIGTPEGSGGGAVIDMWKTTDGGRTWQVVGPVSG
jgi:photosystem II stability/assembly factor-like uncharacterized protein